MMMHHLWFMQVTVQQGWATQDVSVSAAVVAEEGAETAAAVSAAHPWVPAALRLKLAASQVAQYVLPPISHAAGGSSKLSSKLDVARCQRVFNSCP